MLKNFLTRFVAEDLREDANGAMSELFASLQFEMAMNFVRTSKNKELDDGGKKTKKQYEMDKLFQPDTLGISRWVSREEIAVNKTLNWGNNGIGRHGNYFGDKRYNWEKQPAKGAIKALRTIGFSDDILNGANRPIREDIRNYYKKQGCVVCGSHYDLVPDHKNDLYNDPRVLNKKTQTKEDFQCLCNHCNSQKKQVAKTTREKGKRIGATTIPSLAIYGIDFIEGDESYKDSDVNAMVGTFWYDPVAFHQFIKDKLTRGSSDKTTVRNE